MVASAEQRSPTAEETRHETLNRNVNELLQELRVAQAGVQFLFGFLLAVAFTDPFLEGTGFQHGVHLVAMLFATVAVALLTAPVAWHRVLFRQGQRPKIVRVANNLALAGLSCLAVSMTATVLLVTDVLLGGWLAWVLSLAAAAVFVTTWFVLPWQTRRRG
jgi:uncharacterized protein DUF6328